MRAKPLKTIFDALLRVSTEFFSAEHDEPLRDRETIERMRALVLELVSASTYAPRFERFMAYLMGNNEIEAHYSLHAVQMTCLALLTLRERKLKTGEREEIAIAAFFSDFGQRAAWLSFQNDHAEASVAHLKAFRFPWWSLIIERLIQAHHSPASDGSPHRLFSIISRYLAVTRGTGTDQTPDSVLLPARAVDMIMSDETLDTEGKKWFLNAVSVYPLGSWVRLNTGENGLVVANHAGNPLRPVVAIGRSSARGDLADDYVYEEVDLKQELTRFVAGEALPGAFEQSLFRQAERWIPYWDVEAPESASGVPGSSSDLEPPVTPPIHLTARPDVMEAPPPPSATPAVPAGPEPTKLTIGVPPNRPQAAPAPVPAATVAAPALPPIDLVAEANAALQRWQERIERTCAAADQRPKALEEELLALQSQIKHLDPFMEALTSLGDPIAALLRTLLMTWHERLRNDRQFIDETRRHRTAFQRGWEDKRREISEWLSPLKMTQSALSPAELAPLIAQWRNTLSGSIEVAGSDLIHRFEQADDHIERRRAAVAKGRHALDEAERLLRNKLGRSYIRKGLKHRDAGQEVEAKSYFERARSSDPSLWEASLLSDLSNRE